MKTQMLRVLKISNVIAIGVLLLVASSVTAAAQAAAPQSNKPAGPGGVVNAAHKSASSALLHWYLTNPTTCSSGKFQDLTPAVPGS